VGICITSEQRVLDRPREGSDGPQGLGLLEEADDRDVVGVIVENAFHGGATDARRHVVPSQSSTILRPPRGVLELADHLQAGFAGLALEERRPVAGQEEVENGIDCFRDAAGENAVLRSPEDATPCAADPALDPGPGHPARRRPAPASSPRRGP
jgi:hypothetical protein